MGGYSRPRTDHATAGATIVWRERAQERISRASHEAAHTVAAIAHGMGGGTVTIRNDTEADRHVMVSRNGSLEARVRRAGTRSLAAQRPSRPWLHSGSRRARRSAVDAAGEAEAHQLLEHSQTKTRTLVFDRDRWQEHGAIAHTCPSARASSALSWGRFSTSRRPL